MKSVQLTSRAARDFSRAIEYSARHFGDTQSTRYAAGLNRALLMIGLQPNIGRPVLSQSSSVRVVVYKLHRIYYRVNDDSISVLKIIDARRRDSHRP